MHSVAMSSTEHILWTIANILGLVVVVAVAALLSLLIYLVKIIDRRVVAVRETLKAAAANTADTVLIPQVATGVEAVLAEGHHDQHDDDADGVTNHPAGGAVPRGEDMLRHGRLPPRPFHRSRAPASGSR